MSIAGKVLAHHSEAVDRTLIDWIQHQIDEILGLGPLAIVVLLGLLLVLFPLALLTVVWLQRRKTTQRGSEQSD